MYRCLKLRPTNTATELGLFIHACTEGFRQERAHGSFKVTLKHNTDSSKDVTKGDVEQVLLILVR